MQTSPLAQFVDTDRIAKLSHRDLLLMRLYPPTPRMYGLGKYFPQRWHMLGLGNLTILTTPAVSLPEFPESGHDEARPSRRCGQIARKYDPSRRLSFQGKPLVSRVPGWCFWKDHRLILFIGPRDSITFIFSSLRLSPLCGKSAYILFVFF